MRRSYNDRNNIADSLSPAFEEARESARERLKEISKLYTEPTDGPGEELKHKYTLRGVSTNPHTVYMLEKVVVEAEDFDMLDAGSPDWQWWKLEYVSSDPRPVVTEVSHLHVLIRSTLPLLLCSPIRRGQHD